MSTVPNTRPKISREETLAILAKYEKPQPSAECVIVGIRGYYKKSMGDPSKNDAGIYDDAIVVISPDVFRTFNGNTDPEKFQTGLAKLDPGVYEFYKGKHHPSSPRAYNALRTFPEGASLPCTRNGLKSRCSMINIHKGGFNQTFSAGCQTLYPTQWDEFVKLVYAEMTKYRQPTIHYVLEEN